MLWNREAFEEKEDRFTRALEKQRNSLVNAAFDLTYTYILLYYVLNI